MSSSSFHPSDTQEIWFIFQKDHLLLFKNEPQQPPLLLPSQLKPFFLRQHALGSSNGRICYAAEIAETAVLPADLSAIPLRKALDSLGPAWMTTVAKAITILNWDRNHQFCGRCGQLTQAKTEVFERFCASCGLSFFPRLSPSVIVLIKRDEEILMSRSPHFRPGIFGLIAGYVEAGESIEETIHREIKEEVAIEVKNLKYFGSQYWPFPDSLMIGFIADYAAGEIKIDNHEIEAADWYRYDNLPGCPQSSSIARKMIDHFVIEQRQKALHPMKQNKDSSDGYL